VSRSRGSTCVPFFAVLKHSGFFSPSISLFSPFLSGPLLWYKFGSARRPHVYPCPVPQNFDFSFCSFLFLLSTSLLVLSGRLSQLLAPRLEVLFVPRRASVGGFFVSFSTPACSPYDLFPLVPVPASCLCSARSSNFFFLVRGPFHARRFFSGVGERFSSRFGVFSSFTPARRWPFLPRTTC